MRAVAAALILTATQTSAAVVYDQATNSLRIDGETTVYQRHLIREALADHDPDTVFLHGPGGDMYAGLDIGRMLHAANVRIIIPRGQTCASACAAIALSAESLMIDGEAIFHGPFTIAVPATASLDEIGRRYSQWYLEYAEYVAEVGGPSGLVLDLAERTTRCVWLVADEDSPLDDMRLEDRCGATRPNQRPGNNQGAW